MFQRSGGEGVIISKAKAENPNRIARQLPSAQHHSIIKRKGTDKGIQGEEGNNAATVRCKKERNMGSTILSLSRAELEAG